MNDRPPRLGSPPHAVIPCLGCASEILQEPGYAREVAHYLFNFVKEDAAKGPALLEQAAGFLRVRMWGIDADEPHRNALASGDLILIYLGAPEREFIGRAELASAVHDWTPSEAQVYPGDSPSGVLLAQVERPSSKPVAIGREVASCQHYLDVYLPKVRRDELRHARPMVPV